MSILKYFQALPSKGGPSRGTESGSNSACDSDSLSRSVQDSDEGRDNKHGQLFS